RILPFARETDHPTADNSAAHIGIDVTVNGRTGHTRQLLQNKCRNHGLPGAVLEHVEVINDAALGKASYFAQEILQGQPDQVMEFELRFIRAKYLPCLSLPEKVHLRFTCD